MADYQLLEKQRSEFGRECRGWTNAQLNFKPSPTEWSVLEMLDHIVRTEVEIMAAAVKGLSTPRRISFTDHARTRFLQFIFNSERRVKVPQSAAVVLPGTDLHLAAIDQRWQTSREEMARLLETVPSEILRQGIFKHPVGGWMGMPQIIDFFSAHLVHHEFQLSRIRNASLYSDSNSISSRREVKRQG